MENTVAETKIDSATLNKAFTAGDTAENGKPGYLVIEEHIKTEHLESQENVSKEEKPSSEDFAPVITCGQLIIRKQGQDAKKRSSSATVSKETSDIKNSAKQDGSSKRKLDEIEGKENSQIRMDKRLGSSSSADRVSNGKDEERNIRQSYNMLQELFDSKMANVSMDIKDKSKSCSPFRASNRKSMKIDDDVTIEPSQPNNLSRSNSAQQKNDATHVVVSSENIEKSGDAISNLFPDFSVSVLKFQDAIESFSEAMFKDALEESYKESPLVKNEAFLESTSKPSDHVGAEVHHKFHELQNVRQAKKLEASIREPTVEPRHEVVEEPMVEQFVSQLTTNQEVIESIIHSIDPNEPESNAAPSVSGISNISNERASDFSISMQKQSDIVEELLVAQKASPLSSQNKDNEIIEPVFEETIVEEKTQYCSGGISATPETTKPIQEQYETPIITPTLTPKLEQKLDTFTQQILEDSKAEFVTKEKEKTSSDLPHNAIDHKETIKQSISIPEICVTADLSSAPPSAKIEQAKEPTWVNIPIIRGHSMPDQSGSKISIHELSDSEVVDEVNQHSPIISEEGENSRKRSEPGMKSGIEIEDITVLDDENSDPIKLHDVHIAFSRNVEDVNHEEAETFVSITHEGDTGSVTKAVHDYKEAQISLEETLTYDEELKDICEYETGQQTFESQLNQANNSKECETLTQVNSVNLSQENTDINELPEETNLAAENMKALTRSENSANIQTHCEQIPCIIDSKVNESKQSNAERPKCDIKENDTTTKLQHISPSSQTSHKVSSCSTQTSFQNDQLEPVMGWMKAFAMVVTGAILLTYYWIPSDSNTECGAMHDEQGNKVSACSTDGYIGLSHINYEEM